MDKNPEQQPFECFTSLKLISTLKVRNVSIKTLRNTMLNIAVAKIPLKLNLCSSQPMPMLI